MIKHKKKAKKYGWSEKKQQYVLRTCEEVENLPF